MIEIATPFGTATIAPARYGWVAIYVPWRVPGRPFNAERGTHLGQSLNEAHGREVIREALERHQARRPLPPIDEAVLAEIDAAFIETRFADETD